MESLSVISAVLILGLQIMIMHSKEEDGMYTVGALIVMVGWVLNLLALFKVI